MKSILESEEFCRDAFALPDGFREIALARMARGGLRARRVRQLKTVCSVALVALVGGALMLRKPGTAGKAVVAEKPVIGWTVHSKPFDGMVQSKALPENTFVRSSESGIAVVLSAKPRDLEISDEQLLEIAGGRSVGLLKIDGGMELTFLGP